MGYLRNLKWQIAVLLGHENLLKKKRLRAKRTHIAEDDEERELEKRYSYSFIDRNVRRKLRLWLSRTEMDAIALLFDSLSETYPGQRLTRIEFLHMVMQSSGSSSERPEPLTKTDVNDILALFEHAKTIHRDYEYIIPGKHHPYVKERYKKKRWYRLKRKYLGEKWVQNPKTVPEESPLDPEEERQRDMERDSIDLHELLLAFSFWKRIEVAGEILDGMDDITFYFFLFEAGSKLRLMEGEFAMAMRTLLEAVYISDYEDPIGIPTDCDPDEYERQKAKENIIADLEELDRNFLMDTKSLEMERKKKKLVERYLDCVYDDIDQAEMQVLDKEDIEVWLHDNPEALAEFTNNDGESILDHALQDAHIKQGDIDREHFYAFMENSHILTHELCLRLEIKLFELSSKIAQEIFDLKTRRSVRLQEFRQFLRESPDKRLASMIVRVSRAIRMEYQRISPRARQALIQVLRYQVKKPKFATPKDPGEALKQRKQLQSPSLTDLRKRYADRSPLERLRLEPLPEAIEDEVATTYSVYSSTYSEASSRHSEK